MMHRSGWVPLSTQITGTECKLLTIKNVEVVICSMTASVTFRTDRCAKENQVFSDRRVDDVHGTHGATCIVEYPFIGISE